MDQNDMMNGIASMTALGVEAGIGLGIIGMVNDNLDPKRKKKRKAGR